MNDKPLRDLVSAHLDGEISPSEQAELARCLDDSTAAQQELADYRRISELIQELPVDPAPPEFRAAVLQAAERQMLLPAEDPPDGISGSHPGRVRRRWLVSGGVLASAAMLFLAVRLFNWTEPTYYTGASQDVAMQKLSSKAASRAEADFLNESDKKTDRPAVSRHNARRTVVAENAASGQRSRTPALAGAKAKRFRAAGQAVPGAPAVAMRVTKKASGTAKPDTADHVAKAKTRRARIVSGGGSGLVFGSNLKNAHVGQAVEALERSGNRVTVITLTVVDRRAGLDDLQILLARHQIPKVPEQTREKNSSQRRRKKPKRDVQKQPPASLAERPTAVRASAAAAQAASRPRKKGLVAVYVEATPEQLAGVLGELQRRKQFVGLNVGRAIAVTQLDALSRSQVNGRKREQESLFRIAKDASGGKAGTVVAAKPTDSKKGFRKTKTMRRKSNSDADVARPSRQVRLALPAGAVKAGYWRQLYADKPADDGFAGAAPAGLKRGNRALADKKSLARSGKKNRPADRKRAPQRRSGDHSRSVQVLFVFVANPGEPAQPPSRIRPSSAKPTPRKPDSRQPQNGMPG